MKKKSISLNAVNKSSDKSQQVGNEYKKAQVAITAKPTGNNLQSSKPISAPQNWPNCEKWPHRLIHWPN